MLGTCICWTVIRWLILLSFPFQVWTIPVWGFLFVCSWFVLMCSITIEEKKAWREFLKQRAKIPCLQVCFWKRNRQRSNWMQQLVACRCWWSMMLFRIIAADTASFIVAVCVWPKQTGNRLWSMADVLSFISSRRLETPVWISEVNSEEKMFQRQSCISRNCTDSKLPSMCQTACCFEALISGYKKASGQPSSHVIKEKNVMGWLSFCDGHGIPMTPSCHRTLRRALSDAMEKSPNVLLESGGQLEDKIRCLNSGEGFDENRQYGTLLYSTGESIIPGTEETGKYSLLDQRRGPAFCSTVMGREKFWDRLADVHPRMKSVLFAFQAVRISVEAFKYSFPVTIRDTSLSFSHITPTLKFASAPPLTQPPLNNSLCASFCLCPPVSHQHQDWMSCKHSFVPLPVAASSSHPTRRFFSRHLRTWWLHCCLFHHPGSSLRRASMGQAPPFCQAHIHDHSEDYVTRSKNLTPSLKSPFFAVYSSAVQYFIFRF